jgi:hypothetical protein
MYLSYLGFALAERLFSAPRNLPSALVKNRIE